MRVTIKKRQGGEVIYDGSVTPQYLDRLFKHAEENSSEFGEYLKERKIVAKRMQRYVTPNLSSALDNYTLFSVRCGSSNDYLLALDESSASLARMAQFFIDAGGYNREYVVTYHADGVELTYVDEEHPQDASINLTDEMDLLGKQYVVNPFVVRYEDDVAGNGGVFAMGDFVTDVYERVANDDGTGTYSYNLMSHTVLEKDKVPEELKRNIEREGKIQAVMASSIADVFISALQDAFSDMDLPVIIRKKEDISFRL